MSPQQKISRDWLRVHRNLLENTSPNVRWLEKAAEELKKQEEGK